MHHFARDDSYPRFRLYQHDFGPICLSQESIVSSDIVIVNRMFQRATDFHFSMHLQHRK